jgi:hypothetical protein
MKLMLITPSWINSQTNMSSFTHQWVSMKIKWTTETYVYAIFLDASKAFDRVEYVKLFKLLIKKDVVHL